MIASLLRQPRTAPRRRILAIASGGGHWVQLQRLRPAFNGANVTWATVSTAYQQNVAPAPFYKVPDATRWNKLGLIRLALRVLWIVIRTRPHVVVTTGAAPGFFGVFFGRLLGARTAWIDSMANVEDLSLSGRKAGRWTSLWLTQWPELESESGPRFEGAVV